MPGATSSYPDFVVNFLSGTFDTFGTYEGSNPDELSQLWIADIYPDYDPANRVYTVSPTGTFTFDGDLENINDLGGLGLLLQEGPVLVWDGGYRNDDLDQIYFGFEVAAIPGPSTTSVLALAALAGCLIRRRRG